MKADLSHIPESLQPLAVPLSKLQEDQSNARLHSDENLDAIEASLTRFGQHRLAVAREDGTVVIGNGMLAVAQRMGLTHLAVLYVDDSMSEAQARALADNRAAELASWDEEVVVATFNQLDADLQGATGFSYDDIEAMTQVEEVNRGLSGEEEDLPDQAIQLKPAQEYVVIVAGDDSEWDALREALSLKAVRRGGYKRGSVFDAVGVQRVVPAADLLDLLGD